MVGLLVVFILSWLILWFFSKEHITVLGIIPSSRRSKEFSTGFILMAIMSTINLLGQGYFKEISYAQNSDYGIWESLNAIWWTLKADLLEELVFRGAVLYILIKKMGIVKACILDAIAFGVYHWFSYEMFGGRIVPMIYVFLLTGASGWMFAFAFAKTKSLYASLGLHFGWIVVSIVIFSAGPLGNQLFIPEGEGIELGGWPTLIFFLWQAVVTPGIVIWYLQKRYSAPQINKLD